eukprot:1951167-Pyramimonas_sp.AAC.1
MACLGGSRPLPFYYEIWRTSSSSEFSGPGGFSPPPLPASDRPSCPGERHPCVGRPPRPRPIGLGREPRKD